MDELLPLLRRIFNNPLHGLVSSLIIVLAIVFALGSFVLDILQLN